MVAGAGQLLGQLPDALLVQRLDDGGVDVQGLRDRTRVEVGEVGQDVGEHVVQGDALVPAPMVDAETSTVQADADVEVAHAGGKLLGDGHLLTGDPGAAPRRAGIMGPGDRERIQTQVRGEGPHPVGCLARRGADQPWGEGRLVLLQEAHGASLTRAGLRGRASR